MTPKRARLDISDHRLAHDRPEPTDAAEPIDSTDRNEPTEPIETAEPTEPTDRTEPFEPIDKTESSDQRDQRERGAVFTMSSSCPYLKRHWRTARPCPDALRRRIASQCRIARPSPTSPPFRGLRPPWLGQSPGLHEPGNH